MKLLAFPAQITAPLLTLHPATVGLLSAALVAAVALLLLALRRPVGPTPSDGLRDDLRTLYRDCRTPALAVSSSGRVFWLNAAAQEAGFRLGRALAGQLARAYDLDEPQLYRLTRAARERGFALAAVEDRRTRQRCYLGGQLSGRGILWTIQPREQLGLAPMVERDLAFETANIGHAAVAPDGRLSTNARFRELFSVPAKRVLEHLPLDRAPDGSRLLLPTQDGREAAFRVFALADPEDDRRDYLFFPAGEGASAGPVQILDSAPIALLRLDLEGRVIWMNRTARKLLGVDLRPGQALAELVEPLARPISAIVQTALRGFESAHEMVRLSRSGQETFLQISLTRMQLEEDDTLVAVLADASQIRQLEDQFAQSQKMEAIGKLAGGVAHDFNNVLTAISGHADLLLLGKDVNDPDYSDLTQIRQNANRAAALVRQLLAFSRKQTLSPQDLSLRDVISDTLYLLDRLIGENVTLKLEHARDLGAVRADQQQLEQALMNLVVNARDAMSDGGTVTISTRNRSFPSDSRLDNITVPAGEYVEVTVEDDGPGIPPHLLNRVFEPFFTTKSVGEGTGLGLSTVYGIVRQSGGTLSASNRPEGGARFRILLPRAPDQPAASEAPAQVALAEAGSARPDMTGKGVVLLVEDEAPVRSFASRALRLRGYQVEAADSAELAMRYLARPENPVDLIVSDVVMPGMDGPTFAGEARRLRPGLPVIFVSGYAEDSFRNSLVAQDFMFLPKPFSLTELTGKVKDALEGRELASG